MFSAKIWRWSVLGATLAAGTIAGTRVQAAFNAYITIQHTGVDPGTVDRGETIQCGCLATTDFDMSGFTLVLTHDTRMLSFESVSFARGVWSNADYTSASLLDGCESGTGGRQCLVIAAVADTTNSGKLVPAGMDVGMFDAFFRTGACTGLTTIGFGMGPDDNVFVDTNAVGHYLTAADLVGSAISIKAVDAFIRGNARNDPIDVSHPFSASVNILDGVFLLDYLFANGQAPPCLDAADANNDGRLNIVDPITIFQMVFGNAAVTIPAPFDSFGRDTGSSLGCATPPESVGCGAVDAFGR